MLLKNSSSYWEAPSLIEADDVKIADDDNVGVLNVGTDDDPRGTC
jgi:hypothetical protein